MHKTRPCGADGREVGELNFHLIWQGYRMTLQEGRLKPSSSTEKTEAASSMGSDSRPGAHYAHLYSLQLAAPAPACPHCSLTQGLLIAPTYE